MSNTKHTAEPWVVYDGGRFLSIIPEDDMEDITIARTPEHIGKERKLADRFKDATEEDRANAARIVACVNAMAGVEDPAAFMEAARRELRGAVRDLNPATLDSRDLAPMRNALAGLLRALGG